MIKKIYVFLNRISNFIQKPLEFLIAFFLMTGIISVIFQVFYRYVLVKTFSFSFPYTEEYSRYTLIWMTYLGAGIVLKEGSLVSLSLLYDHLKGAPRYVIYFITRFLMLSFMFVVVRFGVNYLPLALMFKSPVLYISGVFLYMMPVFGCSMMIYETFVEILGVICGELRPFIGRVPQDSQGGT